MNGSTKRTRVDAEELADLRSQLFAHLTTLLTADPEADAAKLQQSPAAVAEATLTELGVTSIMAMALKGWVFHQLEAELTTFQLMRPLACGEVTPQRLSSSAPQPPSLPLSQPPSTLAPLY